MSSLALISVMSVSHFSFGISAVKSRLTRLPGAGVVSPSYELYLRRLRTCAVRPSSAMILRSTFSETRVRSAALTLRYPYLPLEAPHAVHEHVRPFAPQRALPPPIDPGTHMPEPVGRRLRGHAVAPRQLAGAADPPSGHAHRARLRQRLLDTGPAPPAAFDRRRLEQGAPGFGHPRLGPAGPGRRPAPAAASPERLPTGLALVSSGVRDLVGPKRRASRWRYPRPSS